MPSPIAHIAAGVGLGLIAKKALVKKADSPQSLKENLAQNWKLFFVAILGSVLPDLDSFIGLITGDFGKYHNNLSHSFGFGLLASLLLAAVLGFFLKLERFNIFAIFFAAYSLHILMDAMCVVTRGVMLFWPLTSDRFSIPIPLFYGVRWSEGLVSNHHLITLLTELLFAALIIMVAIYIGAKPKAKKGN